MSGARLKHLTVGAGDDAREIAVLDAERQGARASSGSAASAPTCRGRKAEALDLWADEQGRAATRFDYSGHGQSGGRFEDGTISRWLEEAEAVFDFATKGPQVLVGSSMGGWLALLLAKRMRERGEGGRLHGMVLLAPAVDMTKDLMWDAMSAAEKRRMKKDGFRRASLQNIPTSRTSSPLALIEDGEKHLFGEHPIETGCPVHVIQGMQDDRRAMGARDEADGASRLRRRRADAGARRRSPAVAAGGHRADDQRGCGDGRRLSARLKT